MRKFTFKCFLSNLILCIFSNALLDHDITSLLIITPLLSILTAFALHDKMVRLAILNEAYVCLFA